VIRKDRISRDMLHPRDFNRAQCDWQKCGNVTADAEAMCNFDYMADAHALRQLQRGNIPRIRKGFEQRNAAEIVAFIIVRSVRAEGRWRVDDHLRGSSSGFDGC